MLAIAGGKGGVGKTTTALGLAYARAAGDERTLIVDADRDMPDLHALARVEPRPTAAALVTADDTGSAATDATLSTVVQAVPDEHRVGVLPAAPGIERATMRRALRRLSCAPPAVVLDCPAGAGTDVADPLRLADGCVVVARETPAGLRDGAKTAALSRAVDTPVVGGLVVGSRRGTAARPPASVRRHLRRLLDAPTTTAPAVERPLSDPRVARARRRLLDALPRSVWSTDTRQPVPGSRRRRARSRE
jgi:septum site-determining protein MinD